MNAFHYILKQLNTYYDQFIMHKRGGWEPWQKRLVENSIRFFLNLAIIIRVELLANLSQVNPNTYQVSMSHFISFSRYQTKCVIEFLFRQLMTS